MSVVTVAYTGTWLIDPADQDWMLRLLKQGRSEKDVLGGSVHGFATGLRRAIATDDEERTSPLVFTRVKPADVERLRDKRGVELLMVDGQGWRRFGVYFALDQVTPIFNGPWHYQEYVVSLSWTDLDEPDAA